MIYFCHFCILNEIVKLEHAKKQKDQEIHTDKEIQMLI